MSANRRATFSIPLSCRGQIVEDVSRLFSGFYHTCLPQNLQAGRQQGAQQVLPRLAAKGGESVPARLELPPQMCGILRRIFHAAAA